MGPGLGSGGEGFGAAEGVGFDVAEEGEEVGIGLDGEGFVAVLVEMAGGFGVVSAVAFDVGIGDPGEIAGQVMVAFGAEDQAPVVGHEAVGEEADVSVDFAVEEDLGEGVVILGFVKDAKAVVAAVDEVVDEPPMAERAVRGMGLG